MDKKIIFIAIFCVSVLANFALGFYIVNNLETIKRYSLAREASNKNIAFTSMFIEKVLMAKKDIDFDTRLSLETAVRNLNDQEVFDQWQKFTKATDKEDAGNQAKELLNLLVEKAKF